MATFWLTHPPTLCHMCVVSFCIGLTIKMRNGMRIRMKFRTTMMITIRMRVNIRGASG